MTQMLDILTIVLPVRLSTPIVRHGHASSGIRTWESWRKGALLATLGVGSID